LRAIVAGERDGRRLAEFRDARVKASQETIAKSLEGTWRPEQLAILQRQLADWDHVQQQIVACDVDLEIMLKQVPEAEIGPQPPPANPPGKSKRRRQKKDRSSRNQPSFNLSGELKRITGVDLTRIDGSKAMTIQTLITEAGLDMSKWPTENHFVSWIGLAPRNDVSGGKVLKKKTRRVVSRLATAFRMAATSLRASDSYLGEQFRRLRTRLGAPKAITAMGAKLARLAYRMLRYGQQYVDQGSAQYEAKYHEQQIRQLKNRAAQHGFTLVSLPDPI
jgi:transposase